MREFVEALRALGPVGVGILAILDSAGVPIVGGVDALLIWVSITNRSSAYTAAAAAIVGSAIGSMILFYIARKGGEAYLNRYTATRRGARLKGWFLEYGVLTLFVPALVPIVPMPLKIFILSAGALGYNALIFLAIITLARVIHYSFVAWLGLQLGADTLPYLRHHLTQLVFIAIGLFVSLYLLIFVLDRRRKLRSIVTESE